MKISRRQLLGTAVIGGLAPATLIAENPAVQTANSYHCEILVCGGGPAGFAAATNAARMGRKVILLEKYGRLGGMGIHARVWPLMGGVKSPFVTEVHKKIGGGSFNPELADLYYADFFLHAGGKLLLHSWATEPMMKGNTIVGVKAISKQGTLTVHADLVIDATGDADIAVAAGVPFEIGRDGDGLVQPMSIMFYVEGVGSNAQYCGSEQAARNTKINDHETWETVTTAAQKTGELPETVGVVRTYKMGRPGKACVNATQINKLFGTKVEDLTLAELECRKQAIQTVEFMNKHLPGYEKCYISHMPSVIGVRETRRICGLQQLKRDDCITGRKWDDFLVRNAHFVIDIHNPAGSGQAEDHTDTQLQGEAASVKPYDIPRGCFIPQKIDGLLVAGRCISGTHDAHASYRVQNICMAMGAGVGTLAAAALQEKKSPTEVDIEKVQKTLFG